MRLPCEQAHWTIIPAIRTEFARAFIQAGLKQSEAAERLGVSEAAVSQYLSDKRGNRNVLDSKTRALVGKLARGRKRKNYICPVCEFALKHGKSKKRV